jgi:thiamine biosynthesis lipoprotein
LEPIPRDFCARFRIIEGGVMANEADTGRQGVATSELRFRAMGSDCHVVVVGGDTDSATIAHVRIDELERRWSRFIDDSEVNRLNRSAGRVTAVSPDTVTLVRRAVDAWRLSGGAFDPTVLGAVIRAGYDRSFDEVSARPGSGRSALELGAADIGIGADTVQLPAGVGFDPGGIGKGLAADLVVGELLEAGAAGACVNLGGDVRVAGSAPDGEAWTIAVEHPWLDRPLALLGLADGAVATSTTLRRRWVADGAARHHLIDPQTGQSSDTDLNLASVVTAQAWAAEVLAKAVILRGAEYAFDILGGTGAAGVAVDDRGQVQGTDNLRHYLGRAELPRQLECPSPLDVAVR